MIGNNPWEENQWIYCTIGKIGMPTNNCTYVSVKSVNLENLFLQLCWNYLTFWEETIPSGSGDTLHANKNVSQQYKSLE